VGDEAVDVLENRARACWALGIEAEAMVVGEQVHGDVVGVITAAEAGRGAKTQAEALPGTDALITQAPGVPLSIYCADCAPIFLLDPVRRAVGLAHAGWQGTAIKIGKKTVRQMVEVYGADPADLLAGVGPCIGPCCYTVGADVAEQFQENFPSHPVLTKSQEPDKWQLDIWQANKIALMEAGVREENIAIAGVCTSCHNDQLFSYRAEKELTGRMAAIIMLKG